MDNKKLLQEIDELKKTVQELKNNAERQKRKSGYFSRLSVFAGVFLSMLITTAVLYAAQIYFTDGDLISAEDVNSNFSELYKKVTTIERLFEGVTRSGDVIQFCGVNVQIMSGSGSTDGTINGLGNLIVGYDEARDTGSIKTGSHNIIVGSSNNYSSYGGIVAGYRNTISGIFACVTGGRYNGAVYFDASHTGAYASVSGGQANTADGEGASVSGGHQSIASGLNASISGGTYNVASGQYASVSGGNNNTASGDSASVSGGSSNTASGDSASVSGGHSRSASGIYDWVAGSLFETE